MLNKAALQRRTDDLFPYVPVQVIKNPFISLRIYKVVFYVQRRFPEKLERCVKLKEKQNAIVCKMSKVFM